MEVFTTGDHHQNDAVLYSDTHFSPYSGPTFSDHPKNHFPPPPPQKLIPIRSNVRSSFSDHCSLDDDVLDAKPLSWQPEDGGGGGGGFGFVLNNCSNLGVPFKDEGLIEAASAAAALSPSSSDETSKLQEPIKEPENNKKRKRKSKRKLEMYVESMMKMVIAKQEEMHKQLIDVLDKNEKESILREQAWRKQEIERAMRDEQARKQHISQSLALISFIQKSLGQEIQIPNFSENQENFEIKKCEGDIEMSNIEESECDPNTKRWPKSEVQALITVRAALNHKFNEKGSRNTVWDDVAAGLSGMGYKRTPKKCKEKWENINKYYRRTMEKGKESKSCTYFRELEMLHKTGFISADSHDDDQSIKAVH